VFTYEQITGRLFRDGVLVGLGYSGHGEGRNKPAWQSVSCVGPIPQGKWKIVGPPLDLPSHGPYVLRLEPDPTTDTRGRSGFLIHGDSLKNPGGASLGCIILPHTIRELVWLSGDRELEVVGGEVTQQVA
jgi:hypothetical protein